MAEEPECPAIASLGKNTSIARLRRDPRTTVDKYKSLGRSTYHISRAPCCFRAERSLLEALTQGLKVIGAIESSVIEDKTLFSYFDDKRRLNHSFAPSNNE